MLLDKQIERASVRLGESHRFLVLLQPKPLCIELARARTLVCNCTCWHTTNVMLCHGRHQTKTNKQTNNQADNRRETKIEHTKKIDLSAINICCTQHSKRMHARKEMNNLENRNVHNGNDMKHKAKNTKHMDIHKQHTYDKFTEQQSFEAHSHTRRDTHVNTK